jgi:[histone H4]-lysine20 N-methyltransferase SETD8
MATAPISKGDYVCEYKGDLVKYTEAKEREAHYEQTGQGSYMFFFSHNTRMWCAEFPQGVSSMWTVMWAFFGRSVDATREDASLGFGRLLNHSRAKANLVPRKIVVDQVPHIVMIAARDIEPSEELLYDYGERDAKTVQRYPWLVDDEDVVPPSAAKRPRKSVDKMTL